MFPFSNPHGFRAAVIAKGNKKVKSSFYLGSIFKKGL